MSSSGNATGRLRFANTVNVRTFRPKTNNYGVNTGETEILSETPFTHENVEAISKESRNRMKAEQMASKQKRESKRDARRADLIKQIEENLTVYRDGLTQMRSNLTNVHNIQILKYHASNDFPKMLLVLRNEYKVKPEVIQHLVDQINQLYSEIEALQPSTVLPAAPMKPIAEEMQGALEEIDHILGEMDFLLRQKITASGMQQLNTMIDHIDQRLRKIIMTPKTPDERAQIVELSGRFREIKGRYNQYVLTGVGKGGSRSTRKHRRHGRSTSRRRHP
jgi:hypothetical protein